MAIKVDPKETYFGPTKTYDSSEGMYRGYRLPSGKYGVAWAEPKGFENIGSQENIGPNFGPHIDFENDGFDTPEEVYDFLESNYGNRPISSLKELESFGRFTNPEFTANDDNLTLLYLHNLAMNYPDELVQELSSYDEKTLNNPIVKELLAKYGKR